MIAAAHRDGVLLPRSEALKQFLTIDDRVDFVESVDPHQLSSLLPFAQSCVRHARRFKNEPCMSAE